MTLPPRQYIATRKREITEQMQALSQELDVLAAMESALQQVQPSNGELAKTAPEAPARTGKRRIVEGGIKATVMRVLVDLEPGKGMTAQDVLVSLKLFFGLDLPRTSLSPQLSRLRAGGMVSLDDGVWTPTEKGRQNYPHKA